MAIKCAIVLWDYRQQPSANKLAKANAAVYSGQAPAITSFDTGSDQYGLIFSGGTISKGQAREAWRRWREAERGDQDTSYVEVD